MKRQLYDLWLRSRSISQTRECRNLLKDAHYGDNYRRIYFYHIRKTAGSSIIQAFLAAGGEESKSVYRRLVQQPQHRAISDKYVYVGWRKYLIEGGLYTFAFSHIPYWELELPRDTFRFTIIRDPFKRAFSHYKILVNFSRQEGPMRPNIVPELSWLGKSMNDFLDKIPPDALLNQLFMFSKEFNVDEAYERICSCEHVMFTEDFDNGLAQLSAKTGFALEPNRTRTSRIEEDVDTSAIDRMREMVEPEMRLYQRLRERFAPTTGES